MSLPTTSRRVASLALVLCLALPLVSCWEEKQPATWKLATGPEAYEKLFWDEVKAKNWAEVERHMGSTFVAIDAEGTHDRSRSMELLKQLDLQDYSLGELQGTPNGHDIMVTYTMVMRGTYKGQPLPSTPFRMMSVWQQVKGGWIAVAHADVVVAPTP
ncbi:MAG: nuclear transport factor 2 family protein [Acidobacteriota bacterium]|nr:nuclear transport factor 2 family protein [Acidobacteriota bacterium]